MSVESPLSAPTRFRRSAVALLAAALPLGASAAVQLGFEEVAPAAGQQRGAGDAADAWSGAFLRLGPDARGLEVPLGEPLGDAFTLAAAVRAAAWPMGQNENGFGPEAPATLIAVRRGADGPPAVLRVRLGRPELSLPLGGDRFVSVSGPDELPTGEWHHVAARVDGDRVEVLVDGEVVERRRVQGIQLDADRALIGAMGKRRVVGDLDDAVVTGFALGETQVAKLVNARSAENLTLNPEAGGLPAPEAAGTTGPPEGLPPMATPNEEPPVLRIADDQRFPVLDGNANVVAVPAVGGGHELYVFTDEPYRLREVGTDESGLPLFGSPDPLPEAIGSGFFNVVADPAPGVLGLVHGGSLKHLRVTRGDGPAAGWGVEGRRVEVAGDPKELEALRLDRHGEKFAGDVNGDGVPDLLFAHVDDRRDRAWADRPFGIRPWVDERDPRIGPAEDRENVGTFRGNDIEHRPTAKTSTVELHWAPGVNGSDGAFSFAAPRPVRLGTGDYPAVWEIGQNRVFVRPLKTDAGTFLVLAEPMGRLLAAPILQAGPEQLHIGAAEPLLASGREFSSLLKGAGTSGVVDIDGDGREEVLMRGGGFGAVTVLGGPGVGRFEELGVLRRTGPGAPVAGIEVSAAQRHDVDGDGRPDILVGTAAGSIFVYPGTADPLVYGGPVFPTTPEGPVLLIRSREVPNLQGPKEAGWGYMNPTAADVNADGLVDLLVNDNTSYPQLLLATGEPMRFEAPKPLRLQGGAAGEAGVLPVQWRTTLAVLPPEADFEGTGRACYAFVNLDRGLSVAVPAAGDPALIERVVELTGTDGKPLILCGHGGQSGRTKIRFDDWDGDGRLDLVLGTAGGLLRWFDPSLPLSVLDFRDAYGVRHQAQPFVWLNQGSNAAPAFEAAGARRIGLKRENGPPALFRSGYHCFGIDGTDLDGDNRRDLIFVDEEGRVRYLTDERIGLAEPARAER